MELLRTLAVLAETPGPRHAVLGHLLGLSGEPDAGDYTEIFGLQVPPYASVYVGAEGALGGEARDRVAGFWRALGQDPPDEPDHLATLLALLATLSDHEAGEQDAARRALRRHSRAALFWEHLGCWIFAYLQKVGEISPPFYAGWAHLLQVALSEMARDLGSPDRLPLHLREAPGLPDPRADGLASFLDGLLAMIRSGMLLTRADLAQGGAALGLSLRIGDRRVMLKTLLDQDPAKTLGWLAALADRWSGRHASLRGLSEEIAGFWLARAATSASLLKALRGEPALASAQGNTG